MYYLTECGTKKVLDEMSTYMQSLVNTFEKLALEDSAASILKLQQYLEIRDTGTYEKHIIPYLACRALIYKGVIGIDKIAEVLPTAPGHIYSMAILSSLLQASEGEHAKFMYELTEKSTVLSKPIIEDVRSAAKSVFWAFLDDCRADSDSFYRLINLLHHVQSYSMLELESSSNFKKVVFNIFSDSTLRVSDRKINQLGELISSESREEEYQKFFTENPAFLNPLASKLISKHKLGNEFITDYVLETLTGDYIAVEIEKPTDCIFTKSNNFTHAFTHAFGQVIDFIEWIEQNISYAQKKLPGISSPSGMLVIGVRTNLNKEQEDKLRRFNKNSNSIEVVTFDDLLAKARTLQANIIHRTEFL